jgi:cellulose synthase/poly-beta-1,6-N-acetylglucosamine synthase-like glycosyltransferase
MHVARRIIEHCCQLEYPKRLLQIQVLDDSTDETLSISSEIVSYYQNQGIDIELVHRKNRQGYKAGALKEALPLVKGEYVAIFDADFIPPPDFLYKTLGHFSSQKVGVVQTRWTHLNEDYSLLTKLQAFQLNVHFLIEQSGRFRGKYFLQFNGTAGVWRKATIIDAGNWQSDTLTEDLDLSYRAQLKGWDIAYLDQVGCPAELPVEMNGLKSQQYRWMKGGAETALKILPSLWKSPVELPKKILGSLHLLSSTVFLLIFISAICSIPMLLFMSWMNISPHFLALFLGATLSIIIVYLFANARQSRNRPFDQLKSMVDFLLLFPLFLSLSMGLSFHNTIAVWDAWTGKKTSFVRTPKYSIRNRNDSFRGRMYLSKQIPYSTWIELVLFIIFLGAAIYGWIIGYTAFFAFHVLIALGFGGIAFYSIKHVMVK